MGYVIYILQFVVVPSVWAFFIDYIRTLCFRKNVHLITGLDHIFCIVGLFSNIILQALILDIRYRPKQTFSQEEFEPIFTGLAMSIFTVILSFQYSWHRRHKKGGE